MMSPTRQPLVCILIVLGVAVGAHAQSTPSKETASISGKVTFHGEAVKGVIVTLRSMEPTSFRKLTSYRGVSNAKGEYRIANVPSGTYSVTPTATAFVFEGDTNGERSLIINGSETVEDFDFSLIRGGVITGKVVDSDGQPMIEEEVYVFSPRDPGVGSVRPAAITDDRGIYRIFAIRPGSYVVAAAKDDVRSTGRPRPIPYSRTYYPGVTDPAQAKVIEVSDGSEATDVDITFSRPLITYTASGRVVSGETGEPLPNVPYGFSKYVGSAPSTTMTPGVVTNSRGEFKLENLPPGQYAVLLAPQAERDFRADELRFQIIDRDVRNLVVQTVKGGSLSGVVVLEGPGDAAVSEQLRDLRLVIFVATESSRRFGTSGMETMVRPDGTFRFGGLPTGNATFMFGGPRPFRIIRLERDGVIQQGGIEVKQGEDVRGVRIVASYSDGSIRGTVEIQNGTIPEKGKLFLRAKKLDGNPGYFSADTDARGQFVIYNLPAGTYEVTAGVFVQGLREPLVQKSEQVVVAAGSTTKTIIKLNLASLQPGR